jgi:2-aminoethylphosphonate-pyruvate transaminase
MSAPVTTALILAAGLGARLGQRGREAPKGFLRLGERPIVEESVALLAEAGIERVAIVTGHLAEFYEELQQSAPRLIATAHNPDFATTGSLRSLACARELVDGDLLLLESDLVYERRALAAALGDPRPDVVLLSAPTGSGDEVWVEVDGGRLVSMSKDRARLGPSVAGELVGISKLSRSLFEALCALAEDPAAARGHYETEGLVALAPRRAIPCRLVPDLAWTEIDDEAALERARERVYPAILARDGARPRLSQLARSR